MNYLSHIYLLKEESNPIKILGLVLPDMTRATHKKFRLKPIDSNTSSEFETLQEGINLHFKTDKVFHQAPFFKKHNKAASELIKTFKFLEKSKYSFFLGHILFELMLDRIILKRLPNFGNIFYEQIESVDLKTINAYFDSIDKVAYNSEFESFFNRFLQSKFLNTYTDNSKLAYALGRVYNYATKQEVDWKNEEVLKDFFDKVEANIEPEFDEIFDYTLKNI